MQVKSWAMIGALFAGMATVWRVLRRRREAEQPVAERIRNPGRLIAGGGVRRMN